MSRSGDEARIDYLAGDVASDLDLDDADRAALDALRSLLADPALWAEPPADLEARIVAATGEAPAADARPARGRSATGRRWFVPFLAGAAAAAAVATVLVVATGDDGEHYPVAARASLAPGAAAPAGAPTGSAAMRITASGLRIELTAPGLPGLFDGSVYECWVTTDAGKQSCGTFHTGGADIVLWSGVRNPGQIRSLGITLEPAGDTDPGPSGRQVLAGPVTVVDGPAAGD